MGKEFTAVVLCGPGSDLDPLVSTSLPKALLPIANKPLLDYVLRLVEESLLSDVLVIAPHGQERDIATHLRNRKKSDEGNTLNVVLETYEEDYEGTAQVLLWAIQKKHLRSDFILLPCDLCLIPNQQQKFKMLQNLCDVHRSGDNLVTSLYFERSASNEEKIKDGPSPILTVIEPKNSLLLDSKDLADYDDDVDIRTSLLERYPVTTTTTSLLPAHVYVCSRRVLDILEALPPIRSFQDDLLPFLCKLQWQDGLLETYTSARHLQPQKHTQSLALGRSSTIAPVQSSLTRQSASITPVNQEATDYKHSLSSQPVQRPLSTSASFWESRQLEKEAAGGDLDEDSDEEQVENAKRFLTQVKSAIVVWKKADGFVARGNNVESIHEMHRMLLPVIASSKPTGGKQDEQRQNSRQIGSDSIVDVNLVIGEKSTIKKSSIGKNVQIGKEVKVSQCIIMDGVVLQDAVKLEGCIVCPYARIGEGSTLTKCEVASKCEVGPETVAKNEKLSDLGE